MANWKISYNICPKLKRKFKLWLQTKRPKRETRKMKMNSFFFFDWSETMKRMAPKKKPQKKRSNNEIFSSIPNSDHKKPSKVPKLLISPENEDRLRRLLLNFRRNTSPVTASLSKTPKKKQLNNLYEKLSCEGFLDDQIELALSSLRVNSPLCPYISRFFWGRF